MEGTQVEWLRVHCTWLNASRATDEDLVPSEVVDGVHRAVVNWLHAATHAASGEGEFRCVVEESSGDWVSCWTNWVEGWRVTLHPNGAWTVEEF